MEIKYNGRLMDSDNFRVMVHDGNGFSRVAEGWDDYQNLLASGAWFDKAVGEVEKPAKSKRKRKTKAVNDANSS